MPKKLLLFGGLTVTSIATFTPGGIFLQKAIKTKKTIEKEKQDRVILISKAEEVSKKWNEDENNKNVGISFLTDSSDADIGKLLGIWDVFKYYQSTQTQSNKSLEYTKTEMEKAEGIYGQEAITNKKESKWATKVTDEGLQKANKKSQYWEKFKEICLILMANDQIKEENMNTVGNAHMLLCNRTSFHNPPGNGYEEYKKTTNSPIGIMEHFGTVHVKPSATQKK